MSKIILFIFLSFLGLVKISAQDDTLKYIFLGHTYQYYTPGYKVDARILNIDVQSYDGIWLGGDVCSESLLYYDVFAYIDSVFNLRHPNTHWAMGNHDARNGNWIWIEELTGRKTYYSSYYKGITYVVLNTNLTPYDCEQLDDQYRMIMNVCDTIQNSSHLIFLMHHGIWNGVPGLPSPYGYAQSNLIYYNFNCQSNESSFVNTIYPRLIEVKNRGVEVICILGDMGARKIDVLSDDGIRFLGTGLAKSYYKDPEERAKSRTDYAIIFKHVQKTKSLTWEFVDFDVLSGY